MYRLILFLIFSFIPEVSQGVRSLQASCSVNTKWGTGVRVSPGFPIEPEYAYWPNAVIMVGFWVFWDLS